MSALTHMLRPRAVAVVGASASRMAQGNVVLANLFRSGYQGAVTVVHPSAAVVDGVKTVPSIADLPDRIDVAVVCVPARTLAGTVAQLEQIGCPSAITVAAGFSHAEDRELRALLDSVDIAVSGPNCMGLINLSDGVPLYTARYREGLPVGNAALIAQSGSAAIALANYPGVGFSKIITSGNEYGVIAADYLDWFATDPHTQVVGLIAESIHEPRRFERSVARLQENGKSIVMLKIGRSALGGQATTAHTGAIVGRYAAYSAYFERIGVPTVRDYDELGAALQCLSIRRKRPAGSRIGVISISGGQGALACDVASEEGMALAELSPGTTETIKHWLPGSVGRNPLDLGASVGSKDRRFDALKAFIADDAVDAVAVMQDAQATLPIHPDHDYLPHIKQVVELGNLTDKPVVMISSTSANTHPMLEALLAGSRVPLLRGIRTGLAGLRATLDQRGATPIDPVVEPLPDSVLEGFRAELCEQSGPVSRGLALRLLEAYGIPFVRSTVVGDEDAAVLAAAELNFPLVVKAVSPQLSHKTEAGGVVTGVADEAELRTAIASIRAAVRQYAPAAELVGFELQEFIETGAAIGVEAVAGFTFDPVLGPLVVVGTGGVLVELAADHQSGLAPIGDDEADAMINRTRLGRLLAGYRGVVAPTDLDGLKQIVCRLGRLAQDMSGLIVEGDLNPVMVAAGSGRSVVVDALFVTASRD
jgi:acetate---CoA ligase (ADP-forming)